jgi:hypothetical protein
MKQAITIVSGLPRSGTSMMMKMLEAGGMTVMSDGLRQADEDNPRGYYEFERVKQLDKADDKTWLKDAEGKVVKIISQLLQDLPADHNYKVVFMRRRMSEILASQKKMLERRGEPTDSISDNELAGLFETHLSKIDSWLKEQPNFEVLYITYHEVIAKPAPFAEKINNFLGGSLSTGKMAAAVDASLHRNRS